jgi:hypothetical protein
MNIVVHTHIYHLWGAASVTTGSAAGLWRVCHAVGAPSTHLATRFTECRRARGMRAGEGSEAALCAPAVPSRSFLLRLRANSEPMNDEPPESSSPPSTTALPPPPPATLADSVNSLLSHSLASPFSPSLLTVSSLPLSLFRCLSLTLSLSLSSLLPPSLFCSLPLLSLSQCVSPSFAPPPHRRCVVHTLAECHAARAKRAAE